MADFFTRQDEPAPPGRGRQQAGKGAYIGQSGEFAQL
jgi:hypothetical protein